MLNGSVIFWQDSFLVRQIVKNTGSTLTHAAIFLNGEVYEATPPCVHKESLDSYIISMSHKLARFKWFAMQPKKPFTDAQIKAMAAYAKTQLGRPYTLRGWWKGKEVAGVFCSQLISDIISKSGLIKSHSVQESPGSLYNRLLPYYTK